jgi:hypothetical protein
MIDASKLDFPTKMSFTDCELILPAADGIMMRLMKGTVVRITLPLTTFPSASSEVAEQFLLPLNANNIIGRWTWLIFFRV